MSWIVVTSKPNHLRSVRKRLRRKGYRAYIPAIARTRGVAKDGKIRHRRHITLLMSYVLVEAPPVPILDLWLHDVLGTKDVRGYLKTGDRPALVTDEAVGSLVLSVFKMRQVLRAQSTKRWLRSGMKAAIKGGSLAGKIGTVQWIKGKRAGLEAQLLGSMRVVEVKLSELEAA